MYILGFIYGMLIVYGLQQHNITILGALIMIVIFLCFCKMCDDEKKNNDEEDEDK